MIGAGLTFATRMLVGGHARWLGCAPQPRARIYFANHASHLDTVILWSALPPALRQRTHPIAARLLGAQRASPPYRAAGAGRGADRARRLYPCRC
jgi:hypothetical protein